MREGPCTCIAAPGPIPTSILPKVGIPEICLLQQSSENCSFFIYLRTNSGPSGSDMEASHHWQVGDLNLSCAYDINRSLE